jgi:tetratricopeptide (TPR) repeat protein
MAKSKKVDTTDNIELVENALSKTEQFIEDNKKVLTIIVIAIVVIVGGYLGYTKLYVAPMEDEAKSQMFVAEQYFEKDSFKLAINGDGNYLGFLGIIDQYGVTKAGNLAEYYAGIAYLHLGQFQQAIDHLKNFSTDDEMIAPVAIGAIGDAYLELHNNSDAISYYKKAIEKASENKFLAPIYLMKLGFAYETDNNYKLALETYQKIDNEYAKTNEGRNVEKYIQRAKLKLGK